MERYIKTIATNVVLSSPSFFDVVSQILWNILGSSSICETVHCTNYSVTSPWVFMEADCIFCPHQSGMLYWYTKRIGAISIVSCIMSCSICILKYLSNLRIICPMFPLILIVHTYPGTPSPITGIEQGFSYQRGSMVLHYYCLPGSYYYDQCSLRFP